MRLDYLSYSWLGLWLHGWLLLLLLLLLLHWLCWANIDNGRGRRMRHRCRSSRGSNSRLLYGLNRLDHRRSGLHDHC